MKISLIHPSRGRAEKAKATYDFWMKQASGKFEIEHIISVDQSDPDIQKYINRFGKSRFLVGNNSCVVEATNLAAGYATGDVLIYLSDDFSCPKNWDLALEPFFKDCNEPRLVKVNDGLQRFEVGVLTIPIMNMALYERLCYFWHPGYKSMFVDEDLYHTCRINNWMVMAPELLFQHQHHVNGMAPNDDTYRQSAANWDQGKAFFAQRKLEGFPLTFEGWRRPTKEEIESIMATR